MDPAEQAQWDRANAEIRDRVPPLLWSFYKACVEQGFSSTAALSLTTTYLQELWQGALDVENEDE